MSHLIAAKVIHFIKTTKEYQQKNDTGQSIIQSVVDSILAS